jgi:hypothetical protein
MIGTEFYFINFLKCFFYTLRTEQQVQKLKPVAREKTRVFLRKAEEHGAKPLVTTGSHLKTYPYFKLF